MADPAQDQDFLNAPSDQQHAYLMAADKDYAAAKPEDQKSYLQHVNSASPLVTGAGMEHPKDTTNALATATLPGERKPGETPTTLSRFSETVTGSPHPLDQIAGREVPMLVSRPGEYAKTAMKQTVEGPARAAQSAMFHPLDTSESIMPANRAVEDAKAGHYGAAAGDIGGGILNTFMLGKGVQSLPEVADSAATLANRAKIPTAMNIPSATPERARGMFERAVAPGGAPAEEREALQQDFDKAAPYLADETRGRAMPGGGVFDKSEGGAMTSARRVHAASDRLWNEHVEPVIDKYSDAQGNGGAVAQKIRGSFTDLDRQTKPAVVDAGNKLATTFDKPLTVRQMADYVTQLNNDKAVTRYYNLGPLEQSQAELADPSLRAKVIAVGALRDSLFDTIGQAGGESLGADFKQARQGWGALRSVEDRLRNVRVPAEEGMPSRIANTVRSIYRPEHWATRQTLGSLNNPNRLATSSLNMLGRTDLHPSAMQGPTSPYVSPRRMLPMGPIQVGPPADTSGPVDLGQPMVHPGTRAERKGLLLSEPAIQVGPTTGESKVTGYQAPPVAMRGPEGKMTRGYSSSVGPQQRGTKMGQIAKVGNESWGWDGDKWYRREP